MEEQRIYTALEIIAGIPLVSGNDGKGKPTKKIVKNPNWKRPEY